MLKVNESLSGRHLLVTGATGFVGKVWLAHLLEHVPEVSRVTLLVRPQGHKSAAHRVREALRRSPAFRSLRQKQGANFSRFVQQRVEALDVNLEEPGLGLDEGTRVRLEASGDMVIHIAGLTDFQPDPSDAFRSNVLSARHVADLAARMAVPRLVHVSTCFVAGNHSGDVEEDVELGLSPNGTRIDVEEEVQTLQSICTNSCAKWQRVDRVVHRAQSLGWPNVYTFTKALTERDLMRRDDLQLTVVRPTVVESAVEYPFAGWNEGLNTSGPMVWLLWSWIRRFRSEPSHIFDVVPVDAVARGVSVLLAAAFRGPQGIVHLGTGATNPLTFGRVFDLTSLGGRRHFSGPGQPWWKRHLLAHLDAVPVAQQGAKVLNLQVISKATGTVAGVLRYGGRFVPALSPMGAQAEQVSKLLRRVDRILELYRPFILENDYRFLTDKITALMDELDGVERNTFRFGVAHLDWQRYWLDVHLPGLVKWSFPLLEGKEAPLDPPAPWEDLLPYAPKGTKRLGTLSVEASS